MSDDERGEEKELDLSSPEVVTKYKSAAEIVNKALQLVLSERKPNTKIVDICEKGDSYIREQTGNMYKNVNENSSMLSFIHNSVLITMKNTPIYRATCWTESYSTAPNPLLQLILHYS